MKIDWTRPVRETFSKKVVRVLCTDGANKIYPIIVESDGGFARMYTKDGLHDKSGLGRLDLENVPEEMDCVWLLYNRTLGFYVRHISTVDPSDNGITLNPGYEYRKFQRVVA
jgi:hypothetical protein